MIIIFGEAKPPKARSQRSELRLRHMATMRRWRGSLVLDANGNEIPEDYRTEYGFKHIGHRNPFRYRGYYYDVNTKLYYLQSRFYDPETGRFLNADTVEYLDPESINGLNLYAYCGNNPVMYSDHSGHAPKWLWNALIGVGIIVGTVLFVAAVIASAGTVGALAGAGAATLGLSATTVSTVATIATISTYAVATGIGLFGLSDSIEAFSGGFNPIRDCVMGGNQTAYNITSNVFNVLGEFTVLAGTFGPKILQKIASKWGTPKISKGSVVGNQITFYDKNGNWNFRIDATVHSPNGIHHNPHVHLLKPDVKQGGFSENIYYFWEVIKQFLRK